MCPRPDRPSCSPCSACTWAWSGSSARSPGRCAGRNGTSRRSDGRRRPWLPDLVLAALAALTGALWVIGLWYLGVYTHPAVLTWQRLARLRGLADQRPLGERLGERVPLLRRAQEETDVGRLLAIAGRSENATGWLLRTGFQAGLALAATLLLDELTLLANGELAYPPALGLAAGACVALLAYARLRGRAARRQRALGQAVADSLPHLAVMTYHHRLPASEALLIFAR